jgi:Glycosyl hydrolase family 9
MRSLPLLSYPFLDLPTGKYSSYYTSATASIYPSTDYKDDMFLGAAWLYVATKDPYYLGECGRWWGKLKGSMDVVIDWDGNAPAAVMLLASLYEDGVAVPGGAEMKTYAVDSFVKAWSQSNGYLDIVKTPKGMSRPRDRGYDWGTLRRTNNAGLAALAYAKHSKSSTTRTKAVQWARSQVDYSMGSA